MIKRVSGTYLGLINTEANSCSVYGVSEIMDIKGCGVYIILCLLVLLHSICLELVDVELLVNFFF